MSYYVSHDHIHTGFEGQPTQGSASGYYVFKDSGCNGFDVASYVSATVMSKLMLCPCEVHSAARRPAETGS